MQLYILLFSLLILVKNRFQDSLLKDLKKNKFEIRFIYLLRILNKFINLWL